MKMFSEILKEFHTYYKTKHPKSKTSIMSRASRTILQEYASFIEEILAPRYGLENIKIILTEFPIRAILICQKLPNTGILWTLRTEYYSPYQIPNTLTDTPDFLLHLKKTIEKNKTIMDAIDSLPPENDDNSKWTHVKIWQYTVYTTIKHLSQKYSKLTRQQQTTNMYNFIENAILEKKETLEIPPNSYTLALSEILTDKLAEHHTKVSFIGLDEHLIPVCHTRNPHSIELVFPDIPTKKQVHVNLKKIDEFNRITNEYLEKVYKRIKTTVRTLNVIINLLH
jgi:hypothetical protein